MDVKTSTQHSTPPSNTDYRGARQANGSVHGSDGSYAQNLPHATASNFSRHSLISNGATNDHIDSVAGFSLPPTAGTNVRVKFIFDFDQTVSAFDSCEWLVKYFKVFRSGIPPHIKNEYKDPSVPYEEFMNEVFREFHDRGRDVNELLQHMRRLPLMDGYLQLFARVRKEHGLFEHPVILSDSFVPLIKNALLGSGIDADATNLQVIAHSCQVSSAVRMTYFSSDSEVMNMLFLYVAQAAAKENSKVPMFVAHGLMNQSQCSSCPSRLCKGLAMQQLFPFLQFVPSHLNDVLLKPVPIPSNRNYNPSALPAADLEAVPNNLRIIYSGDGRNDFCALKSLRECDIGMYKNDSPLAALVASRPNELRCRVFGWENAFDILRVLDEKVLSPTRH